MQLNLTSPGTLFMLGLGVAGLIIIVVILRTMPKKRAPKTSVSWTLNTNQVVCIGVLWVVLTALLSQVNPPWQSLAIIYTLATLVGGGLGAENP